MHRNTGQQHPCPFFNKYSIFSLYKIIIPNKHSFRFLQQTPDKKAFKNSRSKEKPILSFLNQFFFSISKNMGRLILLCFILVEVLFLLAMANGSESNVPKVVSVSKDQSRRVGPDFADPPSSEESSLLDESKTEDQEVAEAPENRRMGKHNHHHSPDKSIAGGGVILGGLATAIFAAVFCYIRVTRRRNSQNNI